MAALLALGASLLWGVSDFLGGLASRGIPASRVLLAGQVAGLVAFLAVVGRAALPDALSGLSTTHVLVAAGAGVAWLVGLACFYRGCAVGPMSIVAPLAATGVVIPAVVGMWSGHKPGPLQACGLGAAVAGVVLCSRGSGEDRSERRPDRLAASYGVCAAVGFGVELTLLNLLSGSTDEDATMLVVRGAALAVMVLATLAARIRRDVTSSTFGPPASERPAGRSITGPLSAGPRGWWLVALVLVIGVADVAAMSMFVRSGDEGSLPTVAVLASLYPAVTVALGRFVAGDPIHRVQRLGLAAVLLGASMVAAS